MSWEKETDEIRRRRDLAKRQGGEEAVKRHHEKGRLTVRERIAALADDRSFQELGEGAGVPHFDEEGNLVDFEPANYVLGFARVNGRRIAVGGEDFTMKGGSPNPAGLRKSVYAEELALTYKVPLVRLHEGGGGSVAGSAGKGNARPLGDPVFSTPRFRSIAQVLGEVPVATAALGAVAGMPAARLVASHFSVMAEDAQVLIAGPKVVARALDENLTKEELGGADVHSRSGVIDNVAANEEEALKEIARFLSYMPDNVWQRPADIETDDPRDRAEESLRDIVPKDRRKPFNMRKVVKAVVDKGSFFEMTRRFGPSLITGLARMNGKSVGVIANDCHFYAGAMTAQAAQKLRRFADMCNTFHLPILSFVDEPGFMIGSASEKAATIRHGTAAIAAVMQSRVPWASVIVHKVFGVAGAAHFGPEGYVLSWPSAVTGALPVEGGVAVAFARQIAAAEDPEALRAELEEKLAAGQSPFPRAEGFSVHELIDPRETRAKLCDWLDWVEPRRAIELGPYKTTMRP
ncbi:carboxyl transferase domain-containing protein [Parvibaculum sp.]|jgi:acetyl-CoA carboxylase carboxyltransferase component|uniref:acyl-CoA carboxylase subunit beta n=1 Tax=Parvibaculum sp. TaxID=2024848 RepID=UPI000C5BD5F7|nr:carboxyl transferase domain-containing protein [Parvibaculum sp.]MAM94808.1 propionyl-CoA carboxylase [Parvibaculum sp.]|tara:strand:- start:19785 stop:21341 length:1557 start_codon:yes stop_codon:yes gene_type:complete